MSSGKHSSYEVVFNAVMREVAPGQVIPYLIIDGAEQAAPSYGYIVPSELQHDGQKIILRKKVKGIRKGVDWEVVSDDT